MGLNMKNEKRACYRRKHLKHEFCVIMQTYLCQVDPNSRISLASNVALEHNSGIAIQCKPKLLVPSGSKLSISLAITRTVDEEHNSGIANQASRGWNQVSTIKIRFVNA